MMKQDTFNMIMKCSTQDLLNERGMELQLITRKVVKSNDQELMSLQVYGEEGKPLPCIYLDELYERYKEGYPIFQMAMEVADVIEGAMKIELDVNKYNNYETAKELLTIRLVGIEENGQWLKDKLWEPMGDFAKVYYIEVMTDTAGRYASAITQSHLQLWGVAKEQVMTDAYKNLRAQKPFFNSFFSMTQKTEEGKPAEDGVKVPFYVLSNEEKQYGAVMIAIPELLKLIGDVLRRNYYVLPSSIHEVLIVPEDPLIDAAMLYTMVKEVNEKEVDARERLSDKVQYYDREKEELRRA